MKNLKDYEDASAVRRKGNYEDNSAAVELKDCFMNLSEEE